MWSSEYVLLVAIAGLVDAHGTITSPKPRVAGKAMAAACGQQVFNNQQSDDAGNIQGMLQVAKSQTDYNAAACNIWQCKGYQAADNPNVQSFTAGQVIPMTFDIRAPHTGVANISVVDTASNAIIGQPLASYSVFASNSAPKAANETALSITMPDLGGKCTKAGECVIQHFWDARNIDQTYESCIDFTMGGSGSGAAPAAPGVSAAPVPNKGQAAGNPTTLATSVVAGAAKSTATKPAAGNGGCNV